MASERLGAAGSQLEGLILRDGAGALYEVPCVVIERYRVTDERRSELADDVAACVAIRADDACAGYGPATWAVHGAIYGPAPDRAPP